jgi:hypothetical protein
MLRVLVDDQVDFRQTFAGVRIRLILGRWDEKADPPYAVPLEGLQELYGL